MISLYFSVHVRLEFSSYLTKEFGGDTRAPHATQLVAFDPQVSSTSSAALAIHAHSHLWRVRRHPQEVDQLCLGAGNIY
jgi:hypothetical protein